MWRIKVEYDLKRKVDNTGALLVRDRKLLVVKSKRYDIWILPGGGVEEGETADAGMEREIREEIGLVNFDCKLYFQTSLGSLRGDDRSLFVNFYLVDSKDDIVLNPSDNIVDYMWVTSDDVKSGRVKVGSGVEVYSIPRLVKDGLMI